MRKIAVWLLAGFVSSSALANVSDAHVAAPEPTAAQIVEKNIAARGGLEAWRKIQSMVWIGHIERPSTSAASLPYVLEQKRPNKTRFEIRAQNRIWVRIYDGAHGWKLRPASDGKPDLQPYTAEELNFAREVQGIDGPLMDYQAKGISVTLGGTDEIEGRKTYRLNVKTPSGASHHVWIDAQTFLDVKYDRQSGKAAGIPGTVSVYYRDYRAMDGLQIPHMIESSMGTGNATDKMVIDKILLNPPLEDRLFAKPNMPRRHHAATVNAESPQMARSVQSMSSGFPGLNMRRAPAHGSVQ